MLGLVIHSTEVRALHDIDAAFTNRTKECVDAAIVFQEFTVTENAERIPGAIRHRLPFMSSMKGYVQRGRAPVLRTRHPRNVATCQRVCR